MLIKSKKIAIVFDSLGIGGIERKIVDISTYYLSQKDTQIILLLKRPGGSFFKKIPPSVVVHNPPKIPKMLLNLFFPVWLFSQFLKLSPDLILSFGNYSSICSVIANLFTQYKLVISEDSSIDVQLATDTFSYIRKLLVKLTYPRASGIITLTEVSKNKLIQIIGSRKIDILPNWLPLCMESPPTSSRQIDILFVGRLEPQKNPLQFLDICQRLLAQRPQLKITMIGDGTLKSDVINHINKYKIRINLLPANSPVEKYYRSSKVLLLTSAHEGFPLTILESFYYQCPVISPQLPEVISFFSYFSNKLLYTNTEQAISNILGILDSPTLSEKITQHYHQKVVSSQKQNFHATVNYLSNLI